MDLRSHLHAYVPVETAQRARALHAHAQDRAEGLDLRVLSVLGRRIKKIRVTKAPVEAVAAEEEEKTA